MNYIIESMYKNFLPYGGLSVKIINDLNTTTGLSTIEWSFNDKSYKGSSCFSGDFWDFIRKYAVSK